MLDRDGFRPNVGIILLNPKNQVFWGKRIRTHSWQFPQGGIKHGETPEQAMFRELEEEVGLQPHHVRIVARTRDWLRYEVPDHFVRREARGHYRGQKQIWFLLQLMGRDTDMNLRASSHPEFDAWRWNDYWVPLEGVIEFKRGVYKNALTELSRFLPRTAPQNRYLRSGMRAQNREEPTTKSWPSTARPHQNPPGKTMLYTFQSKAGANVIMLAAHATLVLQAMGRDPATKGIIDNADLDPALQKLGHAFDEEPPTSEPTISTDTQTDTDTTTPPIHLRQRAWPLFELMQQALTQGHSVTWTCS